MNSFTEGQKLLIGSLIGAGASILGLLLPGELSPVLTVLGTIFSVVLFCVLLVRLVGLVERSLTGGPAGSPE